MSSRACSSHHDKLVRVLIVDDSSMTCWLLEKILNTDPDIEVVGSAADAREARNLIKTLKPDVITLDVEMPGMNGIDFLRNLMRMHPMPVVMVSTLTQRGAEVTLEALSLGAIDYVAKPRGTVSPDRLATYSRELVDKVLVASTAQINIQRSPASIAPAASCKGPAPVESRTVRRSARNLVAIGASTGGTEAIRQVLAGLPADGPGIVVVQHITDEFNPAFVAKLDSLLPHRVCNASEGQTIKSGCVYVAPAGQHLSIDTVGQEFRCALSDAKPVNFHRPSVDVLFNSVAAAAGAGGTGVILTGMGKDGASGLAAIRRAGGYTIAQDEQTSVVWGMPGASVRMGAAIETLPVNEIAARVSAHLADP